MSGLPPIVMTTATVGIELRRFLNRLAGICDVEGSLTLTTDHGSAVIDFSETKSVVDLEVTETTVEYGRE